MRKSTVSTAIATTVRLDGFPADGSTGVGGGGDPVAVVAAAPGGLGDAAARKPAGEPTRPGNTVVGCEDAGEANGANGADPLAMVSR